MVWAKQLRGISCGPKARDPTLGTTTEKIGILESISNKMKCKKSPRMCVNWYQILIKT